MTAVLHEPSHHAWLLIRPERRKRPPHLRRVDEGQSTSADDRPVHAHRAKSCKKAQYELRANGRVIDFQRAR
jgi:hypothetical protein